MSLAITHFVVGMSFGLAIAAISGVRASYVPLVMLVSGIWAMLPDLEKLFDHTMISWLHDSAWSNIFFFHGLLDTLPDLIWPAVGLLMVLLALTIVYALY